MRCLKCGGSTTFSKPYCQEHVEFCDYAATLIREREQRLREQTRVLEEGPAGVDLESLIVSDLLKVLSNGAAHKVDRTFRLLNIEFEVMKSLAQRLAREGLVKRVGLTTRGEGFLVLNQATS